MEPSKIIELIAKWKQFDINKAVGECVKEQEQAIIEINQDQMYKQGVMNVETLQKERYSPAYIKVKKRKATFKETAHVTLRFFGEFYDSMKILVFKNKFVISATDLKWSRWLEPNDRFGSALGLTDEGKSKMRYVLKPAIIDKVNESTGN